MKVIAVIPGQVASGNKFIMEVSVNDIKGLTLSTSCYNELPVTNNGGPLKRVEIKNLQVGDVVDNKSIDEACSSYIDYINSRQEIERSMAILRGALTKLQNLVTPNSIP